jgi:hypothetical protein
MFSSNAPCGNACNDKVFGDNTSCPNYDIITISTVKMAYCATILEMKLISESVR